ncbi:MAG TPA: DUF1998 domain-containing protein [Gammaproteobacteria bacterium]|nr:DUF1998 domain-containing protein [Gammaproteobacteria bacterium]
MSKEYLPVRLSHLLRHCAVGAIVRGPEYLMVVNDIRAWTGRADGHPAGKNILYVDQVRSALGIEQELREPPIAKQLENNKVDGVCIPAVRFPAWMRCPSCGLLYHKPWRGLKIGEEPRCQNKDAHENGDDPCKKKPLLEQVPWVMVHADGHLADTPWHYLAHRDARTPNQKQCALDYQDAYLRLFDRGSSRRQIGCSRCKAKGDFPDSLRVFFGRTRRQPWIAFDETPKIPDEPAEILEVNDTRVHSSITNSALVIPPESRISKGSVVDRLYSSTQKRQTIDQARNALARKTALRSIASDLRCSAKDVEKALVMIQNGYPLYGKQITQGILLESEYQALLEEIPNVEEDEDFVTVHHTTAWKQIASSLTIDSKPRKIVSSIARLVAVNRLKEIMVFKGFQRLNGQIVPPDIINESSWLPAIELYGEGIFFTFDEATVNRWESDRSLRKRTDAVERRFEETGLQFQPVIVISPRFLLLHTLAHLLIRQLETAAGYPAASLKERIYCTASTMPMSGILIYVAVPDVVGSLGGLAELATPMRFLPLLSKAFDYAEWCSLDPVCSEHEGQGPGLLNRAACHACSLVPEPSCAYGNVLLDRVYIKGDQSNGITAFLACVDLEGNDG